MVAEGIPREKMKLEWDENKNQANIRKHGVDFRDSDYFRQKSHAKRTQYLSKESAKMKEEYDFTDAEQASFTYQPKRFNCPSIWTKTFFSIYASNPTTIRVCRPW